MPPPRIERLLSFAAIASRDRLTVYVGGLELGGSRGLAGMSKRPGARSS